MKVPPSNQTVILAGEPRGAVARAGASPVSAFGLATSAMQRMTIVAAQPDAMILYFRADYSLPAKIDPAKSATGGLTDLQRANTLGGRDQGMTSYLKPAEQYAQTQQMLSGSPRLPRIDVLA